MNRFLLTTMLTIALSSEGLAEATKLKLYRPFGEAAEQSKLKMVAVVKGNCIAPSQFAIREDAWRCQSADKQILDPCFVNLNSKAHEILCPASPWNGHATKLVSLFRIDSVQNKPLDMSSNDPWALELSNQIYCLKTQNLQKIESQPIKYRCSNGALLFGSLQRCKALWSALAYKDQQMTEVSIKKAWF